MISKLVVFIISIYVYQTSSLHHEDRIINGILAGDGTFPFMVSIIRSVSEFEFKLCGGSIIDHRWILTAAHCIQKAKVSSMKVFLGSTTYGKGEERSVEAGYFHRNYHDGEDDIGLLKLTKPIKFTANINKINLNSKRVPLEKEATLIGWGLTGKQRTSVKLHYTNVNTTKCRNNNVIEQFFNIDSEPKNIICTSTRNGKGACSGDSGGPLVMNGVQVGIVSRGEPCATGYPDIYTNVADYLDWIKNATKYK